MTPTAVSGSGTSRHNKVLFHALLNGFFRCGGQRGVAYESVCVAEIIFFLCLSKPEVLVLMLLIFAVALISKD